MPKKIANKVRLMLDSGAFSAWTLQQPIDVKDYIKWIKDHSDLLHSIISLDTIPGRFGQKRTRADVDHAAAETYKSHQAIKDAGISGIPVFHRGESFKWLERYIKDGETYIGISPLVDSSEHIKRQWLDQVFSVITDSKGWACIKTHGFGVTNPPLMMRYPWYSVDSTSWVKGGGFGKVNIPIFENGSYNYLKPPIIIHASDVKQVRPRASLAGFGPQIQKVAIDWLESKGFTLTEIMVSRALRCCALLAYFNDLEKCLPLPFTHKHFSFIQEKPIKFEIEHLERALDGSLNKKLYLYHSTNTSNDQSSLLSKMGANNRLLSYYELREYPRERVEAYVRNGWDKTYIRKQPKADWKSRRYLAYRSMKLLERTNNGTFGPVGED